MTRDEAKAKYGEIVGLQWPDGAKHCKSNVIPEPFCWNVVNTAAKRVWTRCYLNKDAEAPLLFALKLLVDRKLWPELKTFDGCFNIRDVRGRPGKISDHAYAMAFDFNADENPLGSPSKLSPEFVQCFLQAGFVHGGFYERKDPMHFSLLHG